MANYILRTVNDNLWKKFKVLCAMKSTSIRDRILELIEADVKADEKRREGKK